MRGALPQISDNLKGFFSMATPVTSNNAPSFIMTEDKLKAHELDMKRRREEHEKKQPLLLRCLDPKFAKECEDKKPEYKFVVDVEWWTKKSDAVVPKSRREEDDDEDDDSSLV
jgi:hypothetical protein